MAAYRETGKPRERDWPWVLVLIAEVCAFGIILWTQAN